MSAGNRSHRKLFAAVSIQHQTQWRSGSILCENSILLRVWEGNHSDRRIPKHWLASGWHEKRSCQARHAVIWPWWMDCDCIHLCLGSVSGHPLSVSRPAVSLWPESLPAIFANGSSLRDLRPGDTGQLQKGKHKSPELSRERFTVYRGAFFEIESLIRKCWWSDPEKVVHTMSDSLRCQCAGVLITSCLVNAPLLQYDWHVLFCLFVQFRPLA